MTTDDREDIRYIVTEEMRRPGAVTTTRVNSCCTRLEELVERMLARRREPTVAEKMVEDYRRLIRVAA
jgi:hypothetical protein